jgi:hypothetical protein
VFIITQIGPASSSEMSPPEIFGLVGHHRERAHLVIG